MIPLRNFRRFFQKTLKQPLYAFRVFKKRIGAYLYYLLGNGRASLPESLTLFLTYRCNLRCFMCGQWGEGGITQNQSPSNIRQELSVEKLKSLICDVAVFKPNITLFGGEPLLYPACIDLIKFIKEKGLHCIVITNGSLLGKLSEGIVDSGLDELNVSLDGGRNLHDSIRGVPGVFNEIMIGLERINYLKSLRDVKKPLINLQCTINKRNYKNLEEMLDVAEEVNADSLTYHNLIFLDNKIIENQKEYDELLGCTSKDWEGFVFEPGISTEILSARIEQIMSKKYRFSVDFYPKFSAKGLKQYYENPSYLTREFKARCLSPWMAGYIFPNGDVKPCLNSSYSFGNIKNTDFADIWNSKSAAGFRQILKKSHIFPVCIRCTELYRY